MGKSANPGQPTEPANPGYREVIERGAVNIFVYGAGEYFDEIGYSLYLLPAGMTEARKFEMLREQVETDFNLPARHRLSRHGTWSRSATSSPPAFVTASLRSSTDGPEPMKLWRH